LSEGDVALAGELDSYRLLNNLDLEPSFTSLGLRPELFRDGSDPDAVSFDAAMSGPTDILWLFRGSDFLGYSLRENRVTHPPAPIAAGWVGGQLPAGFSIGVDSALWAGPGFPNIAYLFRADTFIGLDCSASPNDPHGWTITQEPWPTGQEWLRLPSTDGKARTGPSLEPCAKLYGLRDAANRVHFFTRDGRYARHNLENGEYDVAPTDTASHFPLPPHFNDRVDLAFYGVGDEAEHIFFFSRTDFAEIDIRRNALVRSGAIEQRFPALAGFLTRPQLFLVENYALETYVGPLVLGRLISTLQLPPHSHRTTVVVTRATGAAAITPGQNLIEGASQAAIADFYNRLAQAAPAGEGPSGLAGVSNGIWGGEVKALTGESLDGRRDALVQAAIAALADQARQSTYHQVDQQLMDPAAAAAVDGQVLTRETYDQTNDSNSTRQVEFMELLQAYVSLILLRNVQLAYSNGRDKPDIFALREIDARLADLLIDPGNATAIITYLKQQLAQIQDSSGDMRTFLAAGVTLDVDARARSSFVIDDVTPPQTLEMFGIIKAARSWRQPTYQTRAIDVAPSNTASGNLPAQEISPTTVIARPENVALVRVDKRDSHASSILI
jgi:hypothetical protein